MNGDYVLHIFHDLCILNSLKLVFIQQIISLKELSLIKMIFLFHFISNMNTACLRRP